MNDEIWYWEERIHYTEASWRQRVEFYSPHGRTNSGQFDIRNVVKVADVEDLRE